MYIDASANYKTTNSANLIAGTWYYVAGVYNSTTPEVRLYVNGAEQAGTVSGTIPQGIGDDGGRFHIGAEDSSSAATNFFDGVIDEVKVYPFAMTPSQLNTDYNQGKSCAWVCLDRIGRANPEQLHEPGVLRPGGYRTVRPAGRGMDV